MTKPCDALRVIPNSDDLNHADDHQVSPLLGALIPTVLLISVEHALNDICLIVF